MAKLTAQQWEEIVRLWRDPSRAVTVAQLAQTYRATPRAILKGLERRGCHVAAPYQGVAVKCACGCGARVSSTIDSRKPVFRNVLHYQRWVRHQEAKGGSLENMKMRRRLVIRTVPLAVREHWPKSWCVLGRPSGDIEVYRTLAERARVFTGSPVIPLLVLHVRSSHAA